MESTFKCQLVANEGLFIAVKPSHLCSFRSIFTSYNIREPDNFFVKFLVRPLWNSQICILNSSDLIFLYQHTFHCVRNRSLNFIFPRFRLPVVPSVWTFPKFIRWTFVLRNNIQIYVCVAWNTLQTAIARKREIETF